VFSLAPAGKALAVDLWLDKEQRSVRYLAGHVIWAAPTFLLPHLAQGLPVDLEQSCRSGTYVPWLVANLTLKEAPHAGAGAPLAWDNVPYGSAGLGYVVATHQNLRAAPGPTVLTWYHAMAQESPAEARKKLQAGSRKHWVNSVLAELGKMHHDIRPLCQRVDIFRHGHAMIRPTPGALWGPSRSVLQTFNTGRPNRQLPGLHLAHSDVSGLSLFEEANFRGVRAADRLLRQLG